MFATESDGGVSVGFAAQHRGGERVELVLVRRTLGEVLGAGHAVDLHLHPVPHLRVGGVDHVQLTPGAPRAHEGLQDVGRPHRAGDPTGVPARELQVGAHGAVDVGGAQLRGRRGHRGFLQAEEPRQVHGVAADVHGRTAAQVVLVADVGELRQREAERRFDVLEGAQLAVLDERPHALRERVVAVVERLHHHEAGAVGGGGDLLGLHRVAGEGLLAEHVLARFECGDRPLGVQPVRQRVVDGVDLGVGEEVGVRVEDARDAVLGGERIGARAIARGDRHHLGFRRGAGGLDHGRRRDARRAEDTDADGAHARHCRPPTPSLRERGIRRSAPPCCACRGAAGRGGPARGRPRRRTRAPRVGLRPRPTRGAPRPRTWMLARFCAPSGTSSSMQSPTLTSPSARWRPAPSMERSVRTQVSYVVAGVVQVLARSSTTR